MEDMLEELKSIIELIKINIYKIKNIEYGEDYYVINHLLKEKEKHHFAIKIKEDIELNQIEIALQKLNYAKQKTNNTENLKNIEKIISYYITKRNLINNSRNIRLKELDFLKQKEKKY